MQILNDIADALRSALAYSEDAALTFTQLSFWGFFAAAMTGYCLVYNRHSAARSAYLLAASIFFYYKASGFYVALLAFVTLANYCTAIMIHWCRHGRWAWLAASAVINIGLLGYFKYAEFAMAAVNGILGTDFEAVNIFGAMMDSLRGGGGIDLAQFILPVGISFYTFQALGYNVDVYRRQIPPLKNIIDFGFFVSFFPQLAAGPIVRAKEFIPQIYRRYCLTEREFWQAALLIMAGLTKKIAVSDYIAFNYVDRIFDEPTLYSGFELLMGAYGYAIQIYCDFSGYTDIAIGTAAMFGFRLPVNFNAPYRAHSIADFWHRWHISLSTWLRDYLYIPLGGSRRGSRRTCLNLLITMLLGGLWHGANYKFVAWGGLHGIALIAERRLRQRISPRILRLGIVRAMGTLITFHVVCLLWIVFRAADIWAAADFVERIFLWFNADTALDAAAAYLPVFAIMAGAYGIHWLPARFKGWVREGFAAMPVGVKVAAVALIVFVLFQMSTADSQPFIYFQF